MAEPYDDHDEQIVAITLAAFNFQEHFPGFRGNLGAMKEAAEKDTPNWIKPAKAVLETLWGYGWRRLPVDEHGLADLDGALHSVWLHGNWRFVTQQMTTAERESAAEAVERHHATALPDEPLSDAGLRWWRE